MNRVVLVLMINFIFIVINCNTILSQTYYVDCNAADDLGTGGAESPKKYINSGCLLLSAGDTLIIRDGIYNTPNDYIENVASGHAGIDNIAGSSDDVYTVVRAENDFGVVVERPYWQYHPTIHFRNKNFIRVQGLIVHPQGEVQESVGIGMDAGRECSYISIVRVGGKYGIKDGFSNNITYEECWAWGAANYLFQSYRSDTIALKRCFARHDERLDANGYAIYAKYVPQAAYVAYNTNNITYENCIAIDGQQYSNEQPADYQVTANDYDDRTCNNVNYYGCISLNAQGSLNGDGSGSGRTNGFYTDVKFTAANGIYENCVVWAASGTALAINNGTDTIVRNCTMGANSTSLNVTTASSGVGVDSCIFINNGTGVYRGDTDYCTFFNNIDDWLNGTHGNILTADPVLLYINRIELDSAAKNTGKLGTDRGANIIYRYNNSALTSEVLWPFPNEQIIKNDIFNNEDEHRGWTASDKTLTKYVWEYLGNDIPYDVYEPRTLTIALFGNGNTSPQPGYYTYDYGDVVNISAVPENGWYFKRWEGDVANPSLPKTTATMSGDKTVRAVFGEYRTLTIWPTNGGTTSPLTGPHVYADGESVDLAATPDKGWYFIKWEGDVANPSLANTTATMSGDKTVRAVFGEYRTLTVEPTNGGTTSPLTGSHVYADNESVDLTATPDRGWYFSKWEGDVANPSLANTTATMSGDKTVKAVFGEYRTLTVEPTNGGTTSPLTGSHVYADNESVDLTATPDRGWYFIRWEGDVADPSASETTVTIGIGKTVKAVFGEVLPETKVLTITTDGNGDTQPLPGNYRYNKGEIVNLTVTPDNEWKFDSWDGDVADNKATSTYVEMNEDKTVTASFEALKKDSKSSDRVGCFISSAKEK